MSATRLLVLGVVRTHGRAHGYLVRSELLTWGADGWANIKWGSIYHALRQLAKQGLLTAIEDADAAGRTDYEITEKGDAEFLRLLRGALRESADRPDMLGAGVAFLPALARQEAIALLTERLEGLEADRAEVDGALGYPGTGGLPLHVRELFSLWMKSITGGIEWTRDLIARLENGEYVMAGEGRGGFGEPGTAHLPEYTLAADRRAP
ncbi:DNA-binding PadR family transcriptional regulator [Nocardiopsis mwathae]|uniref:DNA-binding PadR family transcriptional regulator n=1 Tax=Nocardiopsis mwathae TaxID=1472723 RepID=A0A7W9YGA9_9ACTN|nr:PadR family transcriptional regulator [Nocardiopsis mwathae]MBB6171623.1 DNA-binding PadR family transcriptional regulator [Nocardiopsis mwathae]